VAGRVLSELLGRQGRLRPTARSSVSRALPAITIIIQVNSGPSPKDLPVALWQAERPGSRIAGGHS
jgi:hypothetical protein